jgi:hypothetical protein
MSMALPALVSAPTLYVTGEGEALHAPTVDVAPKLNSGLHDVRPEKQEHVQTEAMSDRPPIERRVLRTCAKFICAALVGVCATLGWQAYGDQTKELMQSEIGNHAPMLAQVFAPTATPPRFQGAADQQLKPALGPAELSPLGQPQQKLADRVEPAQLDQHLAPITSDLAAAKQSLEQLSANQDRLARTQEQMGQTIAKLQTLERNLSQKVSSIQTAVTLPKPKPVRQVTSLPAHVVPHSGGHVVSVPAPPADILR